MDMTEITDDFFVNLDLQTALSLPDSRETLLHFCETVQKQFPEMTSFYQRDSGHYVLEADRDSGSYAWLEMQSHRLSAGYFNPPEPEAAYHLHRWLLDRSVYFLGIGGIDVEALDVLFGFNLDYRGNRDDIVFQTLLSGSPLASMAAEHPVRTVEFEPTMVVALTEDCTTQARLSLETRGNSYQVRTGQYENEPISVYFTVRRYPSPGKLLEMVPSFDEQCTLGEEWMESLIVPQILRPLADAIATAQ